MNALPRLALRTLLTAVGWALGGLLLGGAFSAMFAGEFWAGEFRLDALAVDAAWAPLAAAGGAIFALVVAVLRSIGSGASASRRALAVVGALTMLVVVVVADWRTTGEALAVVGGAPHLLWGGVALGAVLGWITLAVGGARE